MLDVTYCIWEEKKDDKESKEDGVWGEIEADKKCTACLPPCSSAAVEVW